MKIFTARNIVIVALIQFSLGLGLLFEPMTRSLVEAFYAPLIAGKQHDFTHILFDHINNEQQMVMQPYGYSLVDRGKSIPLVSLHQSSSEGSFVSYPPAPMDYTVLFRHLYEQGANKIYTLAPLVWEEQPDKIVQEALGYELNRFTTKAIGLPTVESNRQEPLPSHLEQYIIPKNQIFGDYTKLPQASRWYGDAPQLITQADWLPLGVETQETSEINKSAPLFLLWDNKVIPTLPLIAVMRELGLTGKDIKAHFNGKLYLGNKRTVEIDESGRLDLLEALAPTLIDTDSIIIPSIPGMDKKDNQALKQMLSSATAIIVSEPAQKSAEPDANAVTTAKTIHMLMAGITPLAQISYPCLPTWGIWLIIIDVFLVCLWMLRFPSKLRLLISIALSASILLLAWFFFDSSLIWMPFTTPIIIIIMMLIGSFFLPPAPPEEEPKTSTPKETVTKEALTITKEPIFHEPDAIPIPKKSD